MVPEVVGLPSDRAGAAGPRPRKRAPMVDSSCEQASTIVEQDGDRWIGWIEEVPSVTCQERHRR